MITCLTSAGMTFRDTRNGVCDMPAFEAVVRAYHLLYLNKGNGSSLMHEIVLTASEVAFITNEVRTDNRPHMMLDATFSQRLWDQSTGANGMIASCCTSALLAR